MSDKSESPGQLIAEVPAAELKRMREQIDHLKGLVRTAHDNADYIAHLARTDDLRPAVVLLKAEGIMALEAQIDSCQT